MTLCAFAVLASLPLHFDASIDDIAIAPNPLAERANNSRRVSGIGDRPGQTLE